MSSWRRSGFVAAATTAVFLVVQLAIPITRLAQTDRAERFGWQMFSVARSAPKFVVETDTGDREIVLEEYMARVRADIEITGLLPSHLCEVLPGAVVVSWDGTSHQC